MENQTFNYKDDRFSIRPQAPPGGVTHFNLSDSGYGDKNIYHPHKRNNHPNNDINPPPNFAKKEDTIENTPNGAAPVTGNRPSIKLRAPPGGKSSLDYYSSEDNYQPSSTPDAPLTKDGIIYNEPEKKESLSQTEPQTESSSHSNSSSSFFNSSEGKSNYRPVYTPQAPPGGKSSISFGYDEPETKPRPKPRPNPEFQESSFNDQPSTPTKTGRRMNSQTKQNNQSTFNSSIFGSEDDNKPYKPYYAPQAPPGGKDSISLGSSTDQTNQNKQSTSNNSIFSEEENKPYKPYYAPQAPPGGKDSISFGSSEPANTNTSFSGRRRNYKSDHFKSSISFNY